jgi:hypothetical protein
VADDGPWQVSRRDVFPASKVQRPVFPMCDGLTPLQRAHSEAGT